MTSIERIDPDDEWKNHSPYFGFRLDDDKRIRVDPEEFERAAETVALHVVEDLSIYKAYRKTGVCDTTAQNICKDAERRHMYLDGEHGDPRLQKAIDDYYDALESGDVRIHYPEFKTWRAYQGVET